MNENEAGAVVERYSKRSDGDRYSMLRPEVWHTVQERQRAMLRLFAQLGLDDLSRLNLVEVGCGSGGNLLELLRLGFAPERLIGLELLPGRHAQARATLPVATEVWLGDAAQAHVATASQDIVLQSTVFSSLLDDAFQVHLAQTMWRWLKPGGAVLWYDFTFNNPWNADVRGVRAARLRELFPAAHIVQRRITLAPPLARWLCRVHPTLYTAFNTLPPLRTHLLAWIEKPRDVAPNHDGL